MHHVCLYTHSLSKIIVIIIIIKIPKQKHDWGFRTGPDVVAIQSAWESDQDGRTGDDAETDPEKMGSSCRDAVLLMKDSSPGSS